MTTHRRPDEAETTWELLRQGCSRIGIVSTVGPRGANLMAAEWTYLVALRPLHFAIGLQLTNYSTQLIRDRGEFGLTLCDTSLAPVVDFVGHFSGADTDKSRIGGVELREPVVTTTPTLVGGYLNAECRVVSVVELPEYALIIGEAVWTRKDKAADHDPLIRHGGMYSLGQEIRRMIITASATGLDDGRVRVCATAQGADRDRTEPWTITLGSTGRLLHTAKASNLLDTTIEVPAHVPGDRLVIERPDCRSADVPLPEPFRHP
ncbi:flavin reductase family protein [Nocardia terpenica]|uniref:flavin reductase family protein n=1 Tax=Nocardia terpenica TaxID=455432 RepID=UPI001893EB2A|nr:flavin reductase family protein [Nocardia terpenica]MBF6062950.1 flavin reductase family protein [Nocardia terpenica]MBF6104915.1 flavin reductase family protein [Nocardia terpenica]MBF6112648.1 flavin reductase family protein [Nocardia terpenica]MBF6118643.1 flavin reductase family protein [Nocardia terpenica]MBF6155122.1 flavin reductase family protein [Nocardia terpenica]